MKYYMYFIYFTKNKFKFSKGNENLTVVRKTTMLI